MPRILLLSFALLAVQPALAQTCDRDCLRSHITHYLDAMIKRDPGVLPLSPDVRFTEDNEDLELGQGLWRAIEGLGTFRQDVLDVRNATAGTHVVAMEAGNPVLVAIRLKIDAGQAGAQGSTGAPVTGPMRSGLITEVETTVVRNQEEGMIFRPEAIIEASPAMNVTPRPEQRNTREEMIELANRYPEGLRIGSFVESDARFSADAYRFENGQLMAGPGCTFIPGCDNIREQRLPTLSGIRSHVAGVDEELGIVWLRMNFGPGSVMRSEGELTVWEMFKIYDGQITAVEAYMEVVPEGSTSGWE
jgi:hypothetical protein